MLHRSLTLTTPCLVLSLMTLGCGRTGPTAANAPAPTAFALPTEYVTPLSAKDLSGTWIAGAGNGTFDTRPDGTLRIVNESNLVSRGTISDGTLSAPDWNVTGRLTPDRKRFIWSNGAVWTR